MQTPAVRWVYTQLLCKVQFYQNCLHVQPHTGLFFLACLFSTFIVSIDRRIFDSQTYEALESTKHWINSTHLVQGACQWFLLEEIMLIDPNIY